MAHNGHLFPPSGEFCGDFGVFGPDLVSFGEGLGLRVFDSGQIV
jgi:hypothetical protein